MIGIAETGNVSPTQSSPRLNDYAAQVEGAIKRFENNRSNPETLKVISRETLAAASYAQDCIAEQESKIAKVTESLDSLGAVHPNESSSAPHKELAKQKQEAEKVLSQCRLLNVRTKDLLEQAQTAEQDLLKARMFARNPSVSDYISGVLAQPRSLQQEVEQILRTLGNLPLDKGNFYIALVYGGLGMLIGVFWSLYKRRTLENQASGTFLTSPTLATVWNSIIRVSPGLLLFGMINLSFLFAPVGMPSVHNLALSLLVFTISYTILRAILRPQSSLHGFQPLLPNTSRKLFYWGRLLLLATLTSAFFQSVLFDTEPLSNLVGLIRLGVGTLAGLALMRVLWFLRKPIPTVKQAYLHFLSIIVISVAIVALWLGYTNFAIFLFQGVAGTLFILLLGWLLVRIPTEIFDGMDAGNTAWQQKIRRKMALQDEQIVPGLIWLRLVHILIIGSVVIIALLMLWGMSEQQFNLMVSRISSGYEIGGFTLEPLSILSGLSLLAFMILLTQFVKRSLAQHWLTKTNLSRGAREATVTITGYVGVATAVFMGLSMAGINFGSLALIAGALSVGIGFGLQNIVNNFISGLILLFERPIRRGDWIRVGASEGYVKDISIRSTIINTFDRADIIVPNSELISNQVTNMMLNDPVGRVIIPIRVAYSADTQQVMDTLRSVAEIHPAILREQGKLQIWVLFRRFGEDAKHFELRCYIRDVEEILNITSELNLAIDNAFRKAGIRMPYPRQVVELEAKHDPA